MTAPRRAAGRSRGRGSGSGGDGMLGGNPARGALLIVVAAVVGVLLLGKGLEGGQIPSSSGRDDGDPPATNEDGSEVTTTSAPPPPTTHAPADVRVAVLNGGGPAGSAGSSAEVLNAAGFVARGDNTSSVPATAVYYAPGFEADAAAVAAALQIAAAPAPMPATVPQGAAADDGVVVVIGPDFTPPAT